MTDDSNITDEEWAEMVTICKACNVVLVVRGLHIGQVLLYDVIRRVGMHPIRGKTVGGIEFEKRAKKAGLL